MSSFPTCYHCGRKLFLKNCIPISVDYAPAWCCSDCFNYYRSSSDK